jgi:hypothetical protein
LGKLNRQGAKTPRKLLWIWRLGGSKRDFLLFERGYADENESEI